MPNSNTTGHGDSLRNQRGAALVAAILTSTLLVLIASIASQQAQISYLIHHRMREGSEALIAADSGLAAAIADVRYEPRFERFELADGSAFPYSGMQPTAPLPLSFGVSTLIATNSANRVDIVAEARGRNRAARSLTTTLTRTNHPYVPATLYFHGTTPSIAAYGTIAIRGDSRPVAIPATAAKTHQAAQAAQQAFATGGAVLEGSPVAAGAGWTNLENALDTVRNDPNQLTLPELVQGPLPSGVWFSGSSVQVADGTASGVWLIDGDLSVDSSLAFEGILFVLGDILLAESSTTKIKGAVIQAAPGQTIAARGDLSIAYDLDALDRARRLRPGLLDTRARIAGWKDDG